MGYNDAIDESRNDPDRVEWFRNLGLGLFVHWSVDVQLGSVISHSMVGASEDYRTRYIEDLPKTFNPTNFDPDEWARLAKVAGMRYVMFTAKHLNGFAMWDTDTTTFNVTNTPYGGDIVREVADAFRKQDIPIGIYFCPEDGWLLHQQGREVSREREYAIPTNNAELMEHNKAQIRELFTNYGDIDLLFIDGEAEELRDVAWDLQPEVVITRGAMDTPEQVLRDEPADRAWEGNVTIGSQWSYKAGDERYKSGNELIKYFIETRAKGGNLLLNIGPRPDGTIPVPQEDRLRELGLWNFVNHEGIYGVRPCQRIREGNREEVIWFTRASRDEPTTVYAFVTDANWTRSAASRSFTFESVEATEETEVEILGQSGAVFEYRPDCNPEASWTQDDAGLHITATRAQRLYNPGSYEGSPEEVKWSNPPVIKITNARTVEP